MDEVDIDNVEDINELEARLYAQIHHEPSGESNVENRTELSQNGDELVFNINANNNEETNTEVSSNTNRVLSRRYWAYGDGTSSQRQEQPQQSKNFIRNPFKTPRNHEQHRNVNQQSTLSVYSPNTVLNPLRGNKKETVSQIDNEVNKEKTSTTETDYKSLVLSSSINSENNKTENASANNHIDNQKQTTEKKNLKLNPIADWMTRKKNNINKKSNGKSSNDSNKNSSINVKHGLFSRQQQKLEKAKRVEEKKQKSKKAKNFAASIANRIKPSEIIDLDSDNDSNSSDVIVVPTAPPPTFTVDDSDDEKFQVNITMEHEENAVDSTDVQFSSKTASFIKPKETCTQSLTTFDSDEKRLENSSRCTSPCSIQSLDDFIRNVDHVRLLAGSRGVADDEDLLELTSDMNTLVESSNMLKRADDNNKCLEKSKDNTNCNVQEIQGENLEISDLKNSATAISEAQTQSKDYHTDQSQFKALDVYESESDITDSVYSKGLNKSTVIRQIDSSSDDVEDISICSQRTKRLRKRRASSSNKESDANIENLSSSSDNEIEDDNKVLRTPVPYIAKGAAVERYKPQKRNRTLSSCSYLQRSTSANIAGASENLSDIEFLATLNNLAHGQDVEQDINNLEDSEESEAENVPTAREIAEKILAQHNSNEKINQYFTENMALPTEIGNELDKVFKSIDELDTENSKRCPPVGDNSAFKISDSSDSDREKNLIYPSVPNDDVQIVKFSPKKSIITNTRDKDGAPIYNVMYSHGVRKPGGIGWNDEMRKFYNDSWKGEQLILSEVQHKMNPEKNLWKVYTADRFNINSNKRRNIKCKNCCELGHMRSKCTRPKKPIICYMCGESGHYEPRCPNTICLRCGNKTQVFTKSCNVCSYQNRLTCPICKIRGHTFDYCPDKWRRYHSTTEANVEPNSAVDYNPRKYCCICGARGHISDYCRSALVRFTEYPVFTSSIKSHQKSYTDVIVKTPYNGIAVNLMYDPCQEYKFNFVEQISGNKYYGRFLKAVGLEFLIKRKRHINTISSENAESTAKKVKRLSKKYEANPYLKAATLNKKNETMDGAPNQVQEITESGKTDQQDDENHPEEVINIEETNQNEVEIIESEEEKIEDVTCNIQLNTIIKKPYILESGAKNFKSPRVVTKPQIESSSILDSDSNYSFSEHFDVDSNTAKDETVTTEESISINAPSSEILQLDYTFPSNNQANDEERFVEGSSRSKPREMEALPDFIPLIDSTEDQNKTNKTFDNTNVGISRKFVSAESDDESVEKNHRSLSPLPELPNEAKIYLTHFHTKYLLSTEGNIFLSKISRMHKLNTRLDFTSVGHVLIIFGLPSDQNKFQRELLMKYRELEDVKNQRQTQVSLNVPKRTYVLIKFLRENITQLMNNLGNVNQLLKRLQFLERQPTKSGFKLAEKVRRSLNMILIGQAGLQDGTLHLDKLLLSLKTLLNDVSSDVAPPEIRSEITDHWKVIFSAYRHDNYQKLVDTYNNLISKNRLPQLNIDPILLGQKVLDTSFSEEQKRKLEQAKIPSSSANTESSKQVVAKTTKRKANTDTINTSQLSNTNTSPNMNKTKVNTLRADNGKSKSTANNTSILQNINKTSNNASTPSKVKASKLTPTVPNKTQQSTNENLTSKSTINENSKRQPQKLTGPPPFSNPEKRSTVRSIIQQEIDKWKTTCDTLLTAISSKTPISDKGLNGKLRDSKIPSTFWSRESMRYLDDCIRLVAGRSELLEKLQRIQKKSKNGQLSYNDYLAVIKLHTAFNGK